MTSEDNKAEQELRWEFCKRTGHIATSEPAEYFAFCQGVKMAREECHSLCRRVATEDWDFERGAWRCADEIEKLGF